MADKKPAKKSVKKSRKTAANSAGVAKVPQPHGGALLVGGVPGNAGGGRPPDEIRARLRELGAAKSVPFLADLLEGNVSVSLLGKCDECGHDQPISEELVEHFMDRVKASVDQRLKATEQTMKYGLAAKELVVASDNAASFFDCVHRAIVELHGEQAAEIIKARAVILLDGLA